MRAVNLLPADQLKSRRPVNRLVLAGVSSSAAVTMLVAAGFVHEHSAVIDRRAKLDGLKDELAALPAPKQQPAQDGQFAAERGQRITALSAALRTRVAWDRLLRELSSVLPEDVWLETLNAKAPAALSATTPTTGAATPSSAPAEFTIQGYTYSQDGVARLLARLEVVPELANVQLQSSTASALEGQDVVQFSISAELRSGGGVS
jgi:Tfp pilus assembly protein PilN